MLVPAAATGAFLHLSSAGAEKRSIYSIPYPSGDMGYTCYRTPAIVTAANGTLLAFCGGRLKNCSDDGDHDIVLRRSTDNGKTWGPIQIIANDGKNRCAIPVPVVLNDGRILLLWVWNRFVKRKQDRGERRVMICHSDDHGLTWSSSRDITSQVRKPEWKSWYGIGPGHGFIKSLNPAKGRIIIPARHGEVNHGSRSHIIFSDDRGSTWNVGTEALGPYNTSEATACELSDGRVMLNSRSNTSFRIVTLSQDGSGYALKTYQDFNLIEPMNGCQASLLSFGNTTPTKSWLLLFSNPRNSNYRTNGHVLISRNDGNSWSNGLSYGNGNGAFTGYSDITRLMNGEIGVLYESGLSYEKGKILDAGAAGENTAQIKAHKKKRKMNGRMDNRHDAIAFKTFSISSL